VNTTNLINVGQLEAKLRAAGVPIDSDTGARRNLERVRAAQASAVYHALMRGAHATGITVAAPEGLMSEAEAAKAALEALAALEELI
jgi:hypothetical protein